MHMQRKPDYSRPHFSPLNDLRWGGGIYQGPANHMEEEEQQSLELMQGIAEAKACLRSREDMPEVADLSGRSVNRGGVGVSPTPTSSKHPRLDLRPARGSAGKRNRLESSRNHSTWGGGW